MDGEIGVRIVLFVAMTGAGVGVLWSGMAAAAGRLTRNGYVGIRIPSTMASEEAWRAAHARAKRPTVAAGLIAIATGILALVPFPSPALAAIVLTGAALMLGLTLYGAALGRRAALESDRAPRADDDARPHQDAAR